MFPLAPSPEVDKIPSLEGVSLPVFPKLLGNELATGIGLKKGLSASQSHLSSCCSHIIFQLSTQIGQIIFVAEYARESGIKEQTLHNWVTGRGAAKRTEGDKDKNLRVVLKEFPIFGGDSDYAAMAAIAARKQGKYWELHSAMFSHEGKVTAEVVDDLAKKAGLDLGKLKADMKSPEVAQILRDNHALAQSLAISGTPAFIIDDKISPGYLPAEGLAGIAAEVREGGGCKLC
jgi:hypothetical protein